MALSDSEKIKNCTLIFEAKPKEQQELIIKHFGSKEKAIIAHKMTTEILEKIILGDNEKSQGKS